MSEPSLLKDHVPIDHHIPIIDVVVTRHAGLIQYLVEECLIEADTPILVNAFPADIAGKRILGHIPLHLGCLAKSVTEPVLHFPPETRGADQNVDAVRRAFRGFRTYRIQSILP